MMLKAILLFCLLHVMASATQSVMWTKIASNQCVGAKGNNYREITYTGPNTFIIAMKLVHKTGLISCRNGKAISYWGCDSTAATNIIVTDTRNKVIYPSPTLVSLGTGGWYDLPGYGSNSPELVFSDPGFRYLYTGQQLRIWYGEDLFDSTESDNHGSTCMDVFVYSQKFSTVWS